MSMPAGPPAACSLPATLVIGRPLSELWAHTTSNGESEARSINGVSRGTHTDELWSRASEPCRGKHGRLRLPRLSCSVGVRPGPHNGRGEWFFPLLPPCDRHHSSRHPQWSLFGTFNGGVKGRGKTRRREARTLYAVLGRQAGATEGLNDVFACAQTSSRRKKKSPFACRRRRPRQPQPGRSRQFG